MPLLFFTGGEGTALVMEDWLPICFDIVVCSLQMLE